MSGVVTEGGRSGGSDNLAALARREQRCAAGAGVQRERQPDRDCGRRRRVSRRRLQYRRHRRTLGGPYLRHARSRLVAQQRHARFGWTGRSHPLQEARAGRCRDCCARSTRANDRRGPPHNAPVGGAGTMVARWCRLRDGGRALRRALAGRWLARATVLSRLRAHSRTSLGCRTGSDSRRSGMVAPPFGTGTTTHRNDA